jgi:ABC-2 type transport system ATP-binding protein
MPPCLFYPIIMSNILLEAKNIVKKYSEHTALNDVSIQVPKGSIFGLLGPNGAGKTSLIRIINQITGPDSGQILLDGELLQPKHIENIGYLPEERGLYKKMKVGEQLLYLAQLKGMKRNEATEKLKYWFIKFDIKDWWNKTVEDLSKGMQQKTQFIATIVHEPKLIILDEPFSGFDPINANLLKDEILELKQKGSTIIFSTHRMESVEELCDNIALINKSKVVLEGEKKAIKDTFKDHTYLVQHNGELVGDSNLFTTISSKIIDGNLIETIVKKQENISTNQLISNLLEKSEIAGFNEKIPSFNEIFIKVVGEDANSILS